MKVKKQSKKRKSIAEKDSFGGALGGDFRPLEKRIKISTYVNSVALKRRKPPT